MESARVVTFIQKLFQFLIINCTVSSDTVAQLALGQFKSEPIDKIQVASGKFFKILYVNSS